MKLTTSQLKKIIAEEVKRAGVRRGLVTESPLGDISEEQISADVAGLVGFGDPKDFQNVASTILEAGARLDMDPDVDMDDVINDVAVELADSLYAIGSSGDAEKKLAPLAIELLGKYGL